MQYEWREWHDGDKKWLGLLPIDEPNPYSMARIASIYRRPAGNYTAAYFFPHSTGNRQGDGGFFKTLRGAQRYVELNLQKFWEPPAIRNSVLP
jgi:hypothetical protein